MLMTNFRLWQKRIPKWNFKICFGNLNVHFSSISSQLRWKSEVHFLNNYQDTIDMHFRCSPHIAIFRLFGLSIRLLTSNGLKDYNKNTLDSSAGSPELHTLLT